jgi:predicted RNA-binding protein with PUA domain
MHYSEVAPCACQYWCTSMSTLALTLQPMLCMCRLQCPVSLKTVQDGDHRLSRPQDIELIACALAELLNPPQGDDYAADSTDQDQED